MGNGYPDWTRNLFGYMFYDGPARLEKCRFINFNVDNSVDLTSADKIAKGAYVYEGDAALGWFPGNINNYPPTQYTKQLFWEDVDFKHQVYTEFTNIAATFYDGDKNTVILDLDGTLTGYMVTDDQGNREEGRFPISLNNLPFFELSLGR